MTKYCHQYIRLLSLAMIKKIFIAIFVNAFLAREKYNRYLALSYLLCTYFIAQGAYAATNNQIRPASLHPMALSWLQWPPVGRASLTWGFWHIYESELRTPSGKYIPEQPAALFITYQRSITAEDLLDATLEQWEHLGFSQQQIERWRLDLINMWPDVAEGDRLIFVLQDEIGYFFFQPQARKLISLGQLQPPAAGAFIAIWLSARTSYPELRHKLIGNAS